MRCNGCRPNSLSGQSRRVGDPACRHFKTVQVGCRVRGLRCLPPHYTPTATAAAGVSRSTAAAQCVTAFVALQHGGGQKGDHHLMWSPRDLTLRAKEEEEEEKEESCQSRHSFRGGRRQSRRGKVTNEWAPKGLARGGPNDGPGINSVQFPAFRMCPDPILIPAKHGLGKIGVVITGCSGSGSDSLKKKRHTSKKGFFVHKAFVPGIF